MTKTVSAVSVTQSDGLVSVGTLTDHKILIIVENLPVPFDRRVWQEALALRDAGAKVSIICPIAKGYNLREEILEGIQIFRHSLPAEAKGTIGFLKEYSVALFHETRLAWKIHFRHGFDVIHACNPPDLIFLVALPFTLLGKPFIFDHHDINPELYEAKFNRRGFFWYILCCVEWLTFKLAKVVISTNESYREIACTRGGKRTEDVFIVRSSPDLSRLRPVIPNEELRRGRSFLIAYVGVMGEQEGVDLLLLSIQHLVEQKQRTDIQFVLVGNGPQFSTLQQLSIELGLQQFVTFLGRVPDQTLFEVLSGADVCVNPDRVNPMNDKSTMNKIIEYMAFGKPIVQFDVKEGRVSAGEASVYAKANCSIDFANKIEELLADQIKRSRMGSFGKKRVEQELAWKFEVPKLIAAYQRALR